MSELTAARARDRSGRTRVVTTRHVASRSEQQPLPATTTMEGPRHPTKTTMDKDLISAKNHTRPRLVFQDSPSSEGALHGV